MAEAWPGGVPYEAMINSQQQLPFRAPMVTDMEDGQKRQRRSVTKNIASVGFSIMMTNPQFETFKAWVRDTLVDGTLPFTMQIWRGSSYGSRTCTFAERYQDSPTTGNRHVVSVNLDVEDY